MLMQNVWGQTRRITGDVQVANEESYKKRFINRYLALEEPAGS